jgi:predicted HicB family RNase H-like nuclease
VLRRARSAQMQAVEVYKSFIESFNVRVNPELHSKAYERALLKGKTLNQFVKEAFEQSTVLHTIQMFVSTSPNVQTICSY